MSRVLQDIHRYAFITILYTQTHSHHMQIKELASISFSEIPYLKLIQTGTVNNNGNNNSSDKEVADLHENRFVLAEVNGKLIYLLFGAFYQNQGFPASLATFHLRVSLLCLFLF